MKKSRGTLSFVIPEIFNQTSTSFVILEIFYRESIFLNTVDPGLKIAGVTRRWESMFLNNLDPGLKIAGVTEKKN